MPSLLVFHTSYCISEMCLLFPVVTWESDFCWETMPLTKDWAGDAQYARQDLKVLDSL